jgi:hypothetical protein
MSDFPDPRDWIDFRFSDRDTPEGGDSWNRDMLVPCPLCARPVLVESVCFVSPSTEDHFTGDSRWSIEQLGCKCGIKDDHDALQRLEVYIDLCILQRLEGFYPSVLSVENWHPYVPEKERTDL